MKKHTKKLALLAAVLAAAASMTALSACGGGGETPSGEAGVGDGAILSSETASAGSDESTVTDPESLVGSGGFVSGSTVSADPTEYEYFRFEETDDGTAMVLDRFLGIGADAPKDVVIPSTVDGKPVVSIGSNAFSSSRVTSVVMPDTVTTIGKEAFKDCYDLTKIQFSANLTRIQNDAFLECNALAEANFADTKLEYIGYHAFTHTALTEIILPDTVTELYMPFAGCNSLQKIHFPGSLSVIENDVVTNSDVLTEMTFGEGVTHIHSSAFSGFPALQSIALPDSLTQVGSHIFVDSPNVSVTYKGTTYANVGYQVDGLEWEDRAETAGNKALYKAVNGTELVED